MHPIVSSTDGAYDAVNAFVAELSRLQTELRQVGQQLDRIEAEMRHALNDVARRCEVYR
jgi:uncharacterized protein YukE